MTMPADATSSLDIEGAANRLSDLMTDDDIDGTESEGESQQEEVETSEDTDLEEEQDESEADRDDSDDDAEAPEPEADHEVVVDGKPVKVTLDELKKGYSRQADYTKKTQALAEDRKKFAEEQASIRADREQYVGGLQALSEYLDQAYAEPDWDEIRKEHPDEYPAVFADWQRIQAKKAEVKAEQERVAKQHFEELKKQQDESDKKEKELLVQAIPELADVKKAPVVKRQLREYAAKHGFTPEDLAQITDHRAFVLLHKAMRYDALKARPAPVPSKEKPVQTLKPGARVPGKRRQADPDARKRLAKSGGIEDAAAAIGNLL